VALAQRDYSLFSDVSIFILRFGSSSARARKKATLLRFGSFISPAVDNLSAISANQDKIEGPTSVIATPCILCSALYCFEHVSPLNMLSLRKLMEKLI